MFPSGSRGINPLPDLRLLISSGEALPRGLAARLAWLFNPTGVVRVRLLNLYGSTEVSADCCVYDFSVPTLRAGKDGDSYTPIGGPLPGVRLFALSDASPGPASQRLLYPLGGMKPNTVFELCIGGIALSRGYLDQALTVQRFLTLPLQTDTPEENSVRVFRSGDLVSLHRRGSVLLYRGRRSRMFKKDGVWASLDDLQSSIQASLNSRLRSGTGCELDLERVLAVFLDGSLIVWIYFSAQPQKEEMPDTATAGLPELLASHFWKSMTLSSDPTVPETVFCVISSTCQPKFREGYSVWGIPSQRLQFETSSGKQSYGECVAFSRRLLNSPGLLTLDVSSDVAWVLRLQQKDFPSSPAVGNDHLLSSEHLLRPRSLLAEIIWRSLRTALGLQSVPRPDSGECSLAEICDFHQPSSLTLIHATGLIQTALRRTGMESMASVTLEPISLWQAITGGVENLTGLDWVGGGGLMDHHPCFPSAGD